MAAAARARRFFGSRIVAAGLTLIAGLVLFSAVAAMVFKPTL